MDKKKLYFQYSDGADACNIVMELSGAMQWIKADMDDVSDGDYDSDRVYTLKPIWLTDKEFRELPEAEL